MALLGFQKRFVAAIECGTKRHTIRGERPDIRVGVRLDLYAAPRTKSMRLIFRAPCTAIESIVITPSYLADEAPLPSQIGVSINGQWLDPSERDQLARRDGFSNFAQMCRFWRMYRTLPFDGSVIHWDFDKRFMEKRQLRRGE